MPTPPSPLPLPPKSLEPKQRILAATQHLFLSEGCQATTMEALAAHLGLGTDALRACFPTKETLVHATVEAYVANSREELRRQKARSCTAVEELLALREWARQASARIQAPFFQELEQHYPPSWQLWQEHCHCCILGHVRRNLRWGMEQELYRPYLDVEFMARLWLQEIALGLRPSAAAARLGLEPLAVQQTLLEHFLLGIVTPIGALLLQRLQQSPPM